MSVNTYKAIGFLITFLPEPVGDYMKAAQDHLRDIADAYNALAPDWSRAPDDARWYTIDVEGDCAWHDDEPMIYGHGWYSPEKYIVNGIDLPLGVDWRLCKWSRPEAK